VKLFDEDYRDIARELSVCSFTRQRHRSVGVPSRHQITPLCSTNDEDQLCNEHPVAGYSSTESLSIVYRIAGTTLNEPSLAP